MFAKQTTHDFQPAFWAGVTLAVPAQRPAAQAPLGMAQRGPGEWVSRMAQAVTLWRERARDRRTLVELDEHILRDIGLTRTDVLSEAQKPFWRA